MVAGYFPGHALRLPLIVHDMRVGILRQLKDGPEVVQRALQVVNAEKRNSVSAY